MSYLKRKLAERNMTQRELARRIGVSEARISQILSGREKCAIRIDTAYNLCKVLDLDIKEFIEEILK